MSVPANLGPALLAFAAVALGVLSLVFVWEWWADRRRRKEIEERIGGLAGEGGTKKGDPFADLFRDEELTDVKWLEPLVARMPHTRDLQHLIDQADVDWRVGSFVLYTMGGAVGFGLAAWVLSGYPIVALAAAAMGSTIPYLHVKRKKAKRLEKFEEHLPEAIDLLGRAIRAGHAFSTGLGMVADEAPAPVNEEFRRVFEEQRFGLAMEDSMLALADRIDLTDVRIFVTALLIQREVGGNLAEILDKIAHTIRERFTIQRQVRVYTAQGRFTGYLLAVLPIGLGALIGIINHEYMTILFTEPTGRMMIAVAMMLQLVGFFAIRRIIDIDI